MTMDDLIESEGGLESCIRIFGWQGGTITQVKAEIKRRMNGGGIFENQDGVWTKLEITE